MPLLDKDGNAISSDTYKEEPKQEEQTQEPEEDLEPEFKPLVQDFQVKVREMCENIFKRAQLINAELNKQHAMQIVSTVEQASINLLFKKLYNMGISIDEIIDEEGQKMVEGIFDFQKKVDTFTEEDLKSIEQQQNNK